MSASRCSTKRYTRYTGHSIITPIDILPEADLSVISELKNLEILTIDYTNINARHSAQIEILRTALPICKIELGSSVVGPHRVAQIVEQLSSTLSSTDCIRRRLGKSNRTRTIPLLHLALRSLSTQVYFDGVGQLGGGPKPCRRHTLRI